MDRRNFLIRTIAIGAGATSFSSSLMAEPSKELFKISLAQWSLHRALRGGQLDNLDFARTAKRDYGIDAVEYVNQFFADKAQNKPYLTEMKSRAAGEGVRNVLIMIDSEGDLGDPDNAVRTTAVENHYKWIEAAKFLGCHSIRVNAYSKASTPEEQMKLCADGLHRLADFGAKHDLNVIVENHGGISSNGQWVRGLMRMADHPRLGTLPDFGNFSENAEMKDEYDRYKGVDEMMPYAKGVSAKSHDFNASGNETHTDYVRMLKIVLSHGYHGYLGVEYEGETLSEPDGIRATRDLLIRVRDQLSRTS